MVEELSKFEGASVECNSKYIEVEASVPIPRSSHWWNFKNTPETRGNRISQAHVGHVWSIVKPALWSLFVLKVCMVLAFSSKSQKNPRTKREAPHALLFSLNWRVLENFMKPKQKKEGLKHPQPIFSSKYAHCVPTCKCDSETRHREIRKTKRRLCESAEK